MDYGHKETDKMLSELEARIEKEYRKANKEVGEKLDNYLKRFEKKDEIKRKALSDGAITKQEYNQWRIGQIMIGTRWEEMRDTLAQDLTNANKIAASMINGFTPEVYALNHNYGTFEVEKGSLLNTSYTLYDRHTVERLIRDQPNLLPRAKVPIDADKRYNQQLLTSAVTQGVLQGKSMKDIAKDIFPEIRSKANFEGLTKRQASALEQRIKNSAIRNARTMTTAAENGGRQDSYRRAESMGIVLENQWMATLDGRTRHSHRMMDGETRKVGEEFSNGCEYPGDPAGEPEEVYNCRCTLIAQVKGINYDLADVSNLNGKLGSMSYEEWKYGHEVQRTEQRDYGAPVNSTSEKYREGIIKSINDAPEFARNTWQSVQNDLEEPIIAPTRAGEANAYYSPVESRTHFTSEQKAYERSSYQDAKSVFFHEYGHNIDNILGRRMYGGQYDYISTGYKDGIFARTLRKDIENNLRAFYEMSHPGASYIDFEKMSDYEVLKYYSNLPGGMPIERLLISFARGNRREKGSDWVSMVRDEIRAVSESDGDFGRIIDKYFKNNEYFKMQIKDDRNFLVSYFQQPYRTVENATGFAKAVNQAFSIYERSDVADMFDAYYCWYFDMPYAFEVGHGIGYFGTMGRGVESMNLDKMAKEAFAEMYSATMVGEESSSLPVIKKLFPESYKIFQEMLGG